MSKISTSVSIFCLILFIGGQTFGVSISLFHNSKTCLQPIENAAPQNVLEEALVVNYFLHPRADFDGNDRRQIEAVLEGLTTEIFSRGTFPVIYYPKWLNGSLFEAMLDQHILMLNKEKAAQEFRQSFPGGIAHISGESANTFEGVSGLMGRPKGTIQIMEGIPSPLAKKELLLETETYPK